MRRRLKALALRRFEYPQTQQRRQGIALTGKFLEVDRDVLKGGAKRCQAANNGGICGRQVGRQRLFQFGQTALAASTLGVGVRRLRG